MIEQTVVSTTSNKNVDAILGEFRRFNTLMGADLEFSTAAFGYEHTDIIVRGATEQQITVFIYFGYGLDHGIVIGKKMAKEGAK